MKSRLKEEHISTDKRHPDGGIARQPNEKEPSPRLPHEVDESFDSQASEQREVVQQAFDDIDEGQLDTDRRGMPGVEEVRRDHDQATQKEVPASSRIPPSIPKK